MASALTIHLALALDEVTDPEKGIMFRYAPRNTKQRISKVQRLDAARLIWLTLARSSIEEVWAE